MSDQIGIKNRIRKYKTGFRKGAGFFALAVVLLFSAMPVPVHAAHRLQDVGEKLVIVIDPGHGGKNEGTIENGHLEKTMTMVTAMAMYEELLKFDDVEIHLTRTDDRDISLEDRAAFAASVDADFLFSIHYNASANHELFGAEVWVSAFAPFNGYGYQFGNEILKDMRDIGLLIRGVRTKLGDGGDNFYGIIRYCEAAEVPAVIIEHCHVDEARDEGYCDSEEDLEAFGRMDAHAVARYFGLRSSELKVDYSGYPLAEASVSSPVELTRRDTTEPDICEIDFLDADYPAGHLSLTVSAADYDSALLYYSYSLDGGQTFSVREPWPGSDTLTGTYTDTFTLNLKIPSGVTPTVILRAYNMYDLYTESGSYISPQAFGDIEPEEAVAVAAPAMTPEPPGEETAGELSSPADQDADQDMEDMSSTGEVSFLTFLKLCLAVVIAVFALVVISQTIARHRRRK